MNKAQRPPPTPKTAGGWTDNVYIERLEAVADDAGRYSPEEQNAARLAATLFELKLLGDTPDSVKTRLANLPEPPAPTQPQQKMPQQPMMAQQQTTQQMNAQQMAPPPLAPEPSVPELSAEPHIIYPRLRRRLLPVLENVGLYTPTQIVAANLALDAVEGWERQDFEPETMRVPAGPFLMGSTAEQVRQVIAAGLDKDG